MYIPITYTSHSLVFNSLFMKRLLKMHLLGNAITSFYTHLSTVLQHCRSICLYIMLQISLSGCNEKCLNPHLQVPAPPIPAPALGGQSGRRYKEQSFTTFIRIFLLTLITFSLWWSVAIGVSSHLNFSSVLQS